MTFRFSKFPNITVVPSFKQGIRGIEYHAEKPTSVELELSDIKRLIEDKEFKTTLINAMKENTDKLSQLKEEAELLKNKLSYQTCCTGCKYQSSGRDIEGFCSKFHQQYMIENNWYSTCHS